MEGIGNVQLQLKDALSKYMKLIEFNDDRLAKETYVLTFHIIIGLTISCLICKWKRS